ncbi:hypothetical protein T492DRAFT_832226 [Pavlovales sp. CCMP2436]|nr:hypothetical protein T492DRAFT_832226 [Pavlovales sp. CCMP2436]
MDGTGPDCSLGRCNTPDPGRGRTPDPGRVCTLDPGRGADLPGRPGQTTITSLDRGRRRMGPGREGSLTGQNPAHSRENQQQQQYSQQNPHQQQYGKQIPLQYGHEHASFQQQQHFMTDCVSIGMAQLQTATSVQPGTRGSHPDNLFVVPPVQSIIQAAASTNLSADTISIAFTPKLFETFSATKIGVGHMAGRLAELQDLSSGAHHSIVAAIILRLFAATFGQSQAINFLIWTHLDGKPPNFENLVSVVGYALVCPHRNMEDKFKVYDAGLFDIRGNILVQIARKAHGTIEYFEVHLGCDAPNVYVVTEMHYDLRKAVLTPGLDSTLISNIVIEIDKIANKVLDLHNLHEMPKEAFLKLTLAFQKDLASAVAQYLTPNGQAYGAAQGENLSFGAHGAIVRQRQNPSGGQNHSGGTSTNPAASNLQA